ncbi:MAG TPA: hydrogenase maturation protease [Actinomycetota bacterium]|nr:hydrogenase maturation protease [Actinomycetota bacterium]
MERTARTLVLGLGNELAGDDAVGLLVARALRNELAGRAEVVESSASGLALIEVFAGVDRAVVIDAIKTGRTPPGTILEMTVAHVGRVLAPSLHHAGLPELAAVAERVGLRFPSHTRVFAVEVEDPYTLGGGLSESVARSVTEVVARVRDVIDRWDAEDLEVEVTTCTTSTSPQRSSIT